MKRVKKKPSSNEKQRASGHFSCWSRCHLGKTPKTQPFPYHRCSGPQELLSHLGPGAAISRARPAGTDPLRLAGWFVSAVGHMEPNRTAWDTNVWPCSRPHGPAGRGPRMRGRSRPSVLCSKWEASGQAALIYGLLLQPDLFSCSPSLIIKYSIMNSKFLDNSDFFFFFPA